ncbi:MAG: DUF4878 domain-containing protein [Gordonia sp. (in: high G+C Gram-positive bacteria)]|uniref:DUF4878 domain-containing protein n=1 Tax=Gordonia sp. (in: high G+C Gram-positive bacteria) TaxID=84139 RepID=UPI0039E44FB5
MQQKTLRRPVLAIAAFAAGAAIALTGCSSDDSTDSTTGSTAASSAAASAGAGTDQNAAGLTAEQAQTTLRTAVNPDTPEAEIEKVVDTTNPATKAAITGYAKGSSKAGYTPDVYTVKSVEVKGAEATATVAVKSPHAPQPIDIKLTYVDVDGVWKLSGDAVTQLAGMGRGH